MTLLQGWLDSFMNSLLGVWYGVLDFVPSLIIAVVLFVIGWIVSSMVERLIEAVFKGLKIDSILANAGVDAPVERAGYKLNSGRFVGTLVKWFIIVVFLVAAFDIIGLDQVNEFLKGVVLAYLPQVIVAVLVLMVAVVLGDAAQKAVVASARAAHVKSATALGKVTKWAIWIVAILTASSHLGIAPRMIEMLSMGVVVAIALSAGLAFGLGAKDHAGKLVEKLMKDVTEKE